MTGGKVKVFDLSSVTTYGLYLVTNLSQVIRCTTVITITGDKSFRRAIIGVSQVILSLSPVNFSKTGDNFITGGNFVITCDNLYRT